MPVIDATAACAQTGESVAACADKAESEARWLSRVREECKARGLDLQECVSTCATLDKGRHETHCVSDYVYAKDMASKARPDYSLAIWIAASLVLVAATLFAFLRRRRPA